MEVVVSESSPLLAAVVATNNTENSDDEQSPSLTSTAQPSSCGHNNWKIGFIGFLLGVTLSTTSCIYVLTNYWRLASSSSSSWNKNINDATEKASFPVLTSTLWHKEEKGDQHIHHPALHYFAKASTEFAATLPLMKDRNNSFLADLVTSTSGQKPITSGFYRQEAGVPLIYTYEYHEMKIIVAGEFFISDDQGNHVHATPGDVFYFPKGSKITFDSPSFGLGFFCGQRETGTA